MLAARTEKLAWRTRAPLSFILAPLPPLHSFLIRDLCPDPMRFFALLFLTTLVALLHGTETEWRTQSHRGQAYVPLSQIRDVYRFDHLAHSGNKVILKNKEVTLSFETGGQRVLIDDVKFIFTYPLRPFPGLGYHVSVTDLVKVLDPILRPYKAENIGNFDTVIIDPGHGGKDAGAINRLGTEAGYNLKVALRVRERLRKRGFKVVMTRDSDVYLSLSERVTLANRYDKAVFVSIHFNSIAGRSRHQARGIETFALSPRGVAHYGRSLKQSDFESKVGNNQDSANIALATAVHWGAIQKFARAGFRVPDRGIRRARFSVLTGIKHPAILLEGGFLSHPIESQHIDNIAYQKTLGNAIADSLFAYRNAVSEPPSQVKVER